MPPPQLPQMPPQIPQGVNPQMMPRPQMPQGIDPRLQFGGQVTDAEGMAMQKMMMEKARQQQMMEQMFMQERIRGMLGE